MCHRSFWQNSWYLPFPYPLQLMCHLIWNTVQWGSCFFYSLGFAVKSRFLQVTPPTRWLCIAHTYPYLPSGFQNNALCNSEAAIYETSITEHRGLFTVLHNAPHSTVIPLMLSEPPPCDAAEVLGETWVAVGTTGKAWVLSVDTPTPLAHTNTQTLSCGLRIRREV